ncbi:MULTISPECIES: hypothetical protein [Chryseobacterium]|uniref:hypothetical protein n=1 Tax=Chryseobacterium TaxID=59732 RepID=UPI000C9DF155|nr:MULTISPECIES: hypothetical protein [Chryseobacterium]VXB95987.1 conserved hypothetical protein [Chryseobacterium sp. 8AT]
MESLKITIEENTDVEKLKELLLQVKGINDIEIIDDKNPESELKKAFAKTKDQLKKGDYETLVNDIFDILIKK